jgi:tetratricopeptide (TPR) repeat protein
MTQNSPHLTSPHLPTLNFIGFLFTALRASDFTNVGAANNLAEALRVNGDVALAVKLLEHTMQRTRESDLSGLLEHTLGDIFAETGDFDKAGKWYLTAALLQPKNPLYWQSASTLSFGGDAQDLKTAENVLAQGLSELPMHPDLLCQLGIHEHDVCMYAYTHSKMYIYSYDMRHECMN